MSLFNWRGDRKAQPLTEPRAEPSALGSSTGESGQRIDNDARPSDAAPLQSALHRHWQAISADGITASQFIEFLQPFADLDGISVSYVYLDADGKERVYNRRRDDTTVENPLSAAIKEKKISRDEALALARNEEGRVWIESNFMDLK